MTVVNGHRRPDDAPALFAMPGASTLPDEQLDHTVELDDEVGEEEDVLDGDLVGTGLEPYDGDYLAEYDEELETRLAVLREIVADVITNPYVELAAQQVIYVVSGAGVVVRHWRDSRTAAPYQRAWRTAEAVGDVEKMGEWADRLDDYRQARHDRRMDWMALPAELIEIAPRLGLGCLAVLGVIGIALAAADKNASEIVAPFLAVANAVKVMVAIAAATWLPVLLGIPVAAVTALWWVGRRHFDDPNWLGTASDADVDLEIDETTIARALAALRIPQITAYFKEGLPLQFLVTARREGRGTRAVLRLPAGVAAEQISTATRRAQLASGLFRATKETWPSTGDEAGVLDLWVADKGALAEGAGPYPLLAEGFVDYFKGVPYGRTLRGDPLVAPMAGRNTIVGGMPDQGKSSAARVIMAGCALDITAELRIWVPDANYDFEVFRPRCSRYVMGAEDEAIAQILDDLRDLHEEIQIRGELLVKHREPEVTRRLASAGVGLHPLVCLLEEAHVAIQHKVYGEEISDLLEQITKLGRKRAIHLIVSTQAPTKDSMPRGVTRNCSNGIAFAVGDHIANDALLGQGAYRGGHRATELIPGTDAGTALVKGFTGQRSDMVQAYFLSVRKDHDQVTPLIQRALAELDGKGLAVPGSGQPRRRAEQRDFFDDLDEVLGEERVKLADLPALLRELAPGWVPYERLTGKTIRARLVEADVRIITTGNRPALDPLDFRRVMAARATADLDKWEDE